MPKRTLYSFGFAAVAAIAVTFCDYYFLDDVIPNRGPTWTAYELFKTALAVCLSVAIVASVHADGRASRAGSDATSIAFPGVVVLSYVLAAFFVLLFVASPTAFNWLGFEDNVVEYFSALLALSGSALFLGAFLAARRSEDRTPQRRVALWLAPAGAVVLFLLGMEEISWGQRILGWSTPETFAANRQGETNLHNFYTTPVHTIYRLGSWAVFILLPFMVAFGPRLRVLDTFRDFLPPTWVAAMCVPIACFNFNAWPFMPTQVVAFSTLLILAIFYVNAHRAGQRDAAMLFGAGVVLLVVAQAVFLLGGDRFVRHWDVTEYQEFFMAMGLAALAWSARERIRSRSRHPESRMAVGARP